MAFHFIHRYFKKNQEHTVYSSVNRPLLSLRKLQKREFVKTVISSTCITCSVLLERSVSLQRDIAIYWPGLDNTAILVIFADP